MHSLGRRADVDTAGGSDAATSAAAATLPTEADGPFVPTKYGRCPRCTVALRPHLIVSGSCAGTVVGRCSNFWKFEGSQRLCFYSSPLNGPIPPSVASRQARMRADIGFMVQHGPQTSADVNST